MSDEGDIIKGELFGVGDSAHGALGVSGFKTRSDITYQSGFTKPDSPARRYLTAQFFQGKNDEINANVMLADGRFQTVQALKEIDFKNGNKAHISRAGALRLILPQETPPAAAPLAQMFKAQEKTVDQQKPVGRQIEDRDIDLVEKVRNRDQKAFEELYHKHHGMVHYVVQETMSRRMPQKYRTFNGQQDRHTDIDDAVQEVFTSMWNKIEQFTPERSTFKVWLGSVARNQALNSSGTLMRHGKHFTEGESFVSGADNDGLDWVDVLGHRSDDPHEFGSNPEAQILCAEWERITAQRLERAFGALKNETQKNVMALLLDELDSHTPEAKDPANKKPKFIAGGGYERLAEQAGISASAAKSALFRAKNTMKERIVNEALHEEGSYPDLSPEI